MHARGRGTGRTRDVGAIGDTAHDVQKGEQAAVTVAATAANPLLGAATAAFFAASNALTGGVKPTDPPFVPPVDALLSDWLRVPPVGGKYWVGAPPFGDAPVTDSHGHVTTAGADNFNFTMKYPNGFPPETRISTAGRLYVPTAPQAEVTSPPVVPGVPLGPQRSAFLQSVEDMNASVANLTKIVSLNPYSQANASMRDAAAQIGPVRVVPNARAIQEMTPSVRTSTVKTLGILGAIGALAAVAWKVKALL